MTGPDAHALAPRAGRTPRPHSASRGALRPAAVSTSLSSASSAPAPGDAALRSAGPGGRRVSGGPRPTEAVVLLHRGSFWLQTGVRGRVPRGFQVPGHWHRGVVPQRVPCAH